jgi:Coenzyme PQQ synthesis protein D (PqqD)
MSAWRLNRESVSHDVMHGEVVAIHLGTGIYYSLRGTAAVIWQMLQIPVEAAAVTVALAEACRVETAAIETDVGRFLQRLREEQLIVEEVSADPVPGTVAAGLTVYAAPELERFADLQDLLLLDPIHDVGAQGWPHRPDKQS